MRIWIFLSWLPLLSNYCKDKVRGPLKRRIRETVHSWCLGGGASPSPLPPPPPTPAAATAAAVAAAERMRFRCGILHDQWG